MVVSIVLEAPWGPVAALVAEAGVVASQSGGVSATEHAGIDALPRSSPLRAMAERVRDALEAYLRGELEALARVPLVPHASSRFDAAVTAGVRAIPPGRVTSYGRLATAIGWPGAARAVGGAVGRNRHGLFVPCHRVIAGDGTLGGYGLDAFGGYEDGLRLKRALLIHEGVQLPVRRDALLDLVPSGDVGQLTTRR